jgi:hypothetical protein
METSQKMGNTHKLYVMTAQFDLLFCCLLCMPLRMEHDIDWDYMSANYLRMWNAEGFSVIIFHESSKSYKVETMLQKRSYEVLMCCVSFLCSWELPCYQFVAHTSVCFRIVGIPKGNEYSKNSRNLGNSVM